MNTKHTIKTALEALRAHTSRSLLTILGIVIGVAAIIVVMALGRGAQSLVLDQISSLGSDTAVIQPGSGESVTGFLLETITEEDLEAIQDPARVPNLVAATPSVMVPTNVSFEGETYQPMVIGSSADFYINTFDIYPDEGVPFGDDAIESRGRVAVIGSSVAEELFGSGEAVGKNISVGNEKFRVAGVFPETGTLLFFNVDDLVLVPYTTAQTYLLGTDHFNEIIVQVDETENLDKLVYDLETTLRETHDIAPGEDDDFVIQTQQALADQVSAVVSILTAFLSAVVAISLVVGGVGIMNIMLVSVTERTREIGLRKALGATSGDIRRQFLFEAVTLTGVGGVIGVIIGAAIAYAASLVLANVVIEGWSFAFPITGAILGVGISAGVGLLFGIYPASQAAQKSPIEALRYE